MFGSKKNNATNEIIVDEHRVTVSALKKRAQKANRRFWCLLVSAALVSTMVVPYLSMAATVADNNSEVFNGTVIPGYSMGGLKLAAYGIDLNSWGAVKGSKAVQTNYGIWSGDRVTGGDGAKQALSKSNATQDDVANYTLSATDRSQGWQAITGNTNYSLNHPNGTAALSQSSQYDDVAPYRTAEDYNYWDGKRPSSSDNTSADIEVSLYADFVAVSVIQGQVAVLRSPDDRNVSTVSSLMLDGNSSVGGVDISNVTNTIRDLMGRSGQKDFGATSSNRLYLGTAGGNISSTSGGNLAVSNAIPYYVSLKDLMDAYGLSSSHNTMSDLMDAIQKDNGAVMARTAQQKNLLLGTSYSPLNSDFSKNGASDAFNPYPYSMVFSCSDGAGTVVSSIYDNSEAYVYFSPASAYNQYIALKGEYDSLMANTGTTRDTDAVFAFKCGYYLAEMAILESYLEEALPQDMTRGYVGPSEPENVATRNTSADATYLSNIFPGKNAEALNSPEGFQGISYSLIMFDVANALLGMGINGAGGNNYPLGHTSAIMDTLSVFGYANDTTDTYGVMTGLNALENQHRSTIFTPFHSNVAENSENALQHGDSASGGGNVRCSSGMYVPVYYPIQAHKMPKVERTYRFQILSTLPYEVLSDYISNLGFSGDVSLTYSSGAIEGIDTSQTLQNVIKTSEKTAALAAALEYADEDTGYLINNSAKNEYTRRAGISTGDDAGKAFTKEELAGGEGIGTQTTTAARIDAAMRGYQASAMNADNVHDLFDIVRSTAGVRYETWLRFYNPNKSAGQDLDLFLSRVAPAVTTYMPSILVNGYLAAGGDEIDPELTTSNCSYDYYCTPSFSPCFASHSADDCFYGILNYEQRAFYKSSFIRSLSSTAGIPATERYMAAKAQIDQMTAERNAEQETMWKDVATLYVMGKRLAYIQTAANIKYDNQYSGEVLSQLYGVDVGGRSTVWHRIGEKAFKDAKDISFATGLIYGGGEEIYRPSQNGVNVFFKIGSIKFSENDQLGVIKKLDNLSPFDKGFWGGAADAVVGAASAVTFGLVSPNNDVTQGGTALLIPIYDNDNVEIGKVDSNILFTYKYNEALDRLIGEGGQYYWTDYGTIKGMLESGEVEPEIDKEHGQYRNMESALHGVSFESGFNFLQDKGFEGADAQKIISGYQDVIRDANTNISTAVQNLLKDQKTMMKSLPSQMQNCLAWATDQNATVSEASYQRDPNDANVNITVNTGNDSFADPPADGEITNAAQLANYGCEFDPSEGKINSTWDQDTATGISARAVRGVEGSTWVATVQPSAYSISATVMRISTLTADSGTAFPYSGLAGGRLSAGTNRYAEIQAHVIDYTSIENGVAGDLATRQRAQVVKITNPEYTSVSDVGNVFSLIGAFFGELGSSLLKATTNLFNSVFFKADTTLNGSSSSATGTSATIFGTTTNYGIQTKYTPASNYVYDQSKDALVASPTYVAGYDSSSATAGAAGGVTAIDSFATGILLNEGYAFYALIQSIGLVIVMISLLFIAFRNFYAYSVGTKDGGQNIIKAQTQLKVVLPRSIIAIFMIGLPPLSPTSTGFQGGAFLLCQALGSVIGYISKVFMNLDGAGILSIWQFSQSALGAGVGAFLAFLLAAIIISAMMILGTICVIFQSLCLVGFYLTGPIVWAFYVWPYGSQQSSRRTMSGRGQERGGNTGSQIVQELTQRIKLGVFTGGKVGNEAPTGWLVGYCSTALLTVAWSLMLWVTSMLFVGTSGLGGSTQVAVGTAAPLRATGYSTASASLLSTLTLGGTDGGSASWFSVTLATVIAVIVFILMFKLMQKVFQGTAFNSLDVIGNVAKGIAEGAKASSLVNTKTNQDRIEELESRTRDGGKLSGRDLAALAGRRAVDVANRTRDKANDIRKSAPVANTARVLSGEATLGDVSAGAVAAAGTINRERRLGYVDNALAANNAAREFVANNSTLNERQLANAIAEAPEEIRKSLLSAGLINEMGAPTAAFTQDNPNDAIDAQQKRLEARKNALEASQPNYAGIAAGQGDKAKEIYTETMNRALEQANQGMEPDETSVGNKSLHGKGRNAGTSSYSANALRKAEARRYEQQLDKAIADARYGSNEEVRNAAKALESSYYEKVKEVNDRDQFKELAAEMHDAYVKLLEEKTPGGMPTEEAEARVSKILEANALDGRTSVNKKMAVLGRLSDGEKVKLLNSVALDSSGENATNEVKELQAKLDTPTGALEVMKKVNPHDPAVIEAMQKVIPEFDPNKYEKAATILAISASFTASASKLGNDELVEHFVEQTLPARYARSESFQELSAALDARCDSIDDVLRTVQSDSFRSEFPEISEAQWREIEQSMTQYRDSGMLVTEPTCQQLLMPLWKSQGITPEKLQNQIVPQIAPAQQYAQAIPLQLVAAQEGDVMARMLSESKVILSNDTFSLLKEQTDPTTVENLVAKRCEPLACGILARPEFQNVPDVFQNNTGLLALCPQSSEAMAHIDEATLASLREYPQDPQALSRVAEQLSQTAEFNDLPKDTLGNMAVCIGHLSSISNEERAMVLGASQMYCDERDSLYTELTNAVSVLPGLVGDRSNFDSLDDDEASRLLRTGELSHSFAKMLEEHDNRLVENMPKALGGVIEDKDEGKTSQSAPSPLKDTMSKESLASLVNGLIAAVAANTQQEDVDPAVQLAIQSAASEVIEGSAIYEDICGDADQSRKALAASLLQMLGLAPTPITHYLFMNQPSEFEQKAFTTKSEEELRQIVEEAVAECQKDLASEATKLGFTGIEDVIAYGSWLDEFSTTLGSGTEFASGKELNRYLVNECGYEPAEADARGKAYDAYRQFATPKNLEMLNAVNAPSETVWQLKTMQDRSSNNRKKKARSVSDRNSRQTAAQRKRMEERRRRNSKPDKD